MTEVAIPTDRERVVRIPVGLLLSIGEEKPERGPGRPIDYIRAKPGELNQFEREAQTYREHYGDEPHELTDIYFLFDDVPAVLDIRLLAFSQSGIRGVGATNFAAIQDDTEFERRLWGEDAFKDGFTFFPKEAKEVRPELRENWEGEPIEGELLGLGDAATKKRVEQLQIKVVCSLEFCLPEIMGLGKVARISTSGRASIRNLWKALWTEYVAFGYRLQGVPFRLALRGRPTQRFDAGEKKYVKTTIYELVIDTTHTVSQLRESLEAHRKAFGSPSREHLALAGRALKETLALPMAGETERTRDEEVAQLPDHILNRIAALEHEVDDDKAVELMLLGAFGVDTATELSEDQAERYIAMLERAMPAEPVDGEVVNGNGHHEDSVEEPHEAKTSDKGERGGSSPDGEEKSDLPSSTEDDFGDEPGGVEEVVDERLIELASETVVTMGRTWKGKSLAEVDDDWLEWALRNTSRLTPQFTEALELYAKHRRTEVWEKVHG